MMNIGDIAFLITASIPAIFFSTSLYAASASPEDISIANSFKATNYAANYLSPVTPTNTITTRACIGEKDCPVPVASMAACGNTEQSVANALCTIYDDKGRTILKHTIQHQGTHEGDMCGYAWFLVSCILP